MKNILTLFLLLCLWPVAGQENDAEIYAEAIRFFKPETQVIVTDYDPDDSLEILILTATINDYREKGKINFQTHDYGTNFIEKLTNSNAMQEAILLLERVSQGNSDTSILKGRNGIVVIPKDELRAFFKKAGPKRMWKKLFKKYDAETLYSFSPVAYYEDYAVVYTSGLCGSLCGSGNLLVFKKDDNAKWVIICVTNLWVS